MKTKSNLFQLSALISFFILLSSFFVTHDKDSTLNLISGKVEGKILIKMDKTIGSSNGRTLEGQYTDNQKTGVWKLWNKDHKLLQTRDYKNNLEYSIIKNNKEVSSSPRLVRDKEGLYNHETLQENHISYVLRVWKEISEDELQNNNMLTYSLGLIPFADFKAYYDEDLRIADSTNFAKELDYTGVRNLRIMGDWYFDNNRNIAQFEILALSPVLRADSTTLWFYYGDMRKSLSQIAVESLNKKVLNMDDLFYLEDYGSIMYKTEGIPDNAFTKDMQEVQTKAVLEGLLKVEAAMWVK